MRELYKVQQKQIKKELTKSKIGLSDKITLYKDVKPIIIKPITITMS